jgi:creatine kinase
MCRAERREVEKVISNALQGMTGDYAGNYYSLKSMTPQVYEQLVNVCDHKQAYIFMF